MTETERLRELLDERGVGSYTHEVPVAVCLAFFDGKRWHDCWESTGGEVNVTFSMTPEQAVEATLGRGTCQMEFLEAAQFSDEDMRHYFEVGVYRCSECGTETYGRWTEGEELERPDFCPACGRRAVG